MFSRMSIGQEGEEDQIEVLGRQGSVRGQYIEEQRHIQISTEPMPFNGYQYGIPIEVGHGLHSWSQHCPFPQAFVPPEHQIALRYLPVEHSPALATSQVGCTSPYPLQGVSQSTSNSTSYRIPQREPRTKPQRKVDTPQALTTGKKCTHCGRIIMTDFARHMRIHEPVSRFQCLYPCEFCPHKTGSFNRLYDFKKHLLHCHFKLSDSRAIRINKLSDKLDSMGQCPCGRVMSARDYLENHIMMKDEMGQFKCLDLKEWWEEVSNQ